MVKRKNLEQKSNDELLKYVRVESCYVYEAIEMAYDILKKKRGYSFSETEEYLISQQLTTKKSLLAEEKIEVFTTQYFGY